MSKQPTYTAMNHKDLTVDVRVVGACQSCFYYYKQLKRYDIKYIIHHNHRRFSIHTSRNGRAWLMTSSIGTKELSKQVLTSTDRILSGNRHCGCMEIYHLTKLGREVPEIPRTVYFEETAMEGISSV